jgi:hypothetical protein
MTDWIEGLAARMDADTQTKNLHRRHELAKAELTSAKAPQWFKVMRMAFEAQTKEINSLIPALVGKASVEWGPEMLVFSTERGLEISVKLDANNGLLNVDCKHSRTAGHTEYLQFDFDVSLEHKEIWLHWMERDFHQPVEFVSFILSRHITATPPNA